jgi:hypothetical protein
VHAFNDDGDNVDDGTFFNTPNLVCIQKVTSDRILMLTHRHQIQLNKPLKTNSEDEQCRSSQIGKQTQSDNPSLTPHPSLQLQDLHVANVIATSRAAVLTEELHAAQAELRQRRLQAIALDAHNRILQIQLVRGIETSNELHALAASITSI